MVIQRYGGNCFILQIGCLPSKCIASFEAKKFPVVSMCIVICGVPTHAAPLTLPLSRDLSKKVLVHCSQTGPGQFSFSTTQRPSVLNPSLSANYNISPN